MCLTKLDHANPLTISKKKERKICPFCSYLFSQGLQLHVVCHFTLGANVSRKYMGFCCTHYHTRA